MSSRDSTGQLAFLRGIGGGVFAAPEFIAVGAPTDWVEVRDLTGDGVPDLLAAVRSNYGRLVFLPGLGGGQFAVLTLPCSTEAEALERAAAASNSLARPFDISGHMIHCEASVGVALAPGDADDWRMMLRNASLALQEHKKRSLDQQNSAGYCVFRRTAEPSSIRRLALLSELRQGLANNALELRYVPQIDLHSGRVSKVEAVLHWERPEDSTKLPADFLEMAEQSGLIQPLTPQLVHLLVRTSPSAQALLMVLVPSTWA